jgi:hypothetical protein
VDQNNPSEAKKRSFVHQDALWLSEKDQVELLHHWQLLQLLHSDTEKETYQITRNIAKKEG